MAGLGLAALGWIDQTTGSAFLAWAFLAGTTGSAFIVWAFRAGTTLPGSTGLTVLLD